MNHGGAVLGRLDADCERRVRVGAGVSVAPGATEEGGFPFGAGLFAKGLDFVLGCETLVSLALCKKLEGDVGVTLGAFELAHHVTVVVETQPAQALQDGCGGFGSGPCTVRVFDAQKELAAAATGIKPVEQRGACTSDVQITGGRGGKAGDDLVCHDGLNLSVTKMELALAPV